MGIKNDLQKKKEYSMLEKNILNKFNSNKKILKCRIFLDRNFNFNLAKCY